MTKLLTILLILSGVVFSANAKTIYVNKEAIRGANNGTSWSNAYTGLQSAIDGAVSGDLVWVAAGTYLPTSWPNGGSSTKEKHFSLKNGVAIYGGFGGSEALLSERNLLYYKTILSGDIKGDDVNAGAGETLTLTKRYDNVYHLFYLPQSSNLNPTAVLDGVIIEGGYAFSSGIKSRGAGVYIEGCNPTLKNCIFRHNMARSGAGAFLSHTSAIVEGCKFQENRAYYGAGINCEGTLKASFRSCEFSRNYAQNMGAGLRALAGSLNIDSCLFEANYSKISGALSGKGTGYTLTNSVFRQNRSLARGAALFNDTDTVPVTLSVTGCQFDSNQCQNSSDGGAVYNAQNLRVTFADCVFSQNVAGDNGGAVCCYKTVASVFDKCSFVGNKSLRGNGGALYGTQSLLKVSECSFSSNEATLASGGAIYSANVPQGSYVSGSFFQKNSAKYGGAITDGSSAPLLFVNNTLIENRASLDGGAVKATGSSRIYLAHCTVLDNMALDDGGAVYGASAARPILCNSIFWGNTKGNAKGEEITGTGILVTHCVVEGGFLQGNNIISSDPQLLPLQKNLGVTLNREPPETSVAINAGTKSYPLGLSVTTDQRGLPRDGVPDIGAIERVRHTVTFIAEVGGVIDGEAIQKVPHKGRTTVVTARALDGYIFAGWKGEPLHTDTTYLIDVVTSSLTRTAEFWRDADKDKLPDSWEQPFVDAGKVESIEKLTPWGDDDGDGFYNSWEYNDGQDPFVFNINVYPGWNLVHLPRKMTAEQSEAKVLFPSSSGEVWRWNATAKNYETVTKLEPGVGYWVMWSGSAAVVSVPGQTVESQVIDFKRGWNLVGVMFQAVAPSEASLSSDIWYWNGEKKYYRKYSARTLSSGRGYWFYSSADIQVPLKK